MPVTILEDLLDDLRHLEENFVPSATTVKIPLTREQLTVLINALDALFAAKRAVDSVDIPANG